MRQWDHQRRRRPVELGDEPPLTLGAEDPERYTRRGVSVRWLFGAVVTAVTSVALMGGALIAALDGRYVVSAEAAIADPSATARAGRATKGDRVEPAYEPVSSRRVIAINTVVRQGEEDLIASRPYALINATLVADKADIGEIPDFNAGELATSEETPVALTDAIYDKEIDGEISVKVESFPLQAPAEFDDGLNLSEAEIAARLMEEQLGVQIPEGSEEEAFVPGPGLPPANVTVVPENVSELIKSTEAADGEDGGNELVELVQPGDTLSKILLGSGVAGDDIQTIARVLSREGVPTLRPEQVVRIAFEVEEIDESARRRPSRLSIYEDGLHLATVAMRDDGGFVSAKAPPGPPPVVEDAPEVASADRRPSIYASLYQTANDNELPATVRDSLLATFSLDVDFNAQVRPGDRLTVLHSETEDGPAEILFASLTAGGVERRFYRYKLPDGTVDFYDEDGRTGDKFLLRKPMQRGVFRSGFGMRNHPILRRRRMHKGVDWAAPRGTKIYAAGDGVIKQAGWRAGYGRWVSITHANGYETGYAHQSRIAKGMKPGVRVKQGQVIGYVGSTGFSTGPHLHYEVRVNGRHVNPLKIRLRRGRELSGDALSSFQAERDRIDEIIAGEGVDMARAS